MSDSRRDAIFDAMRPHLEDNLREFHPSILPRCEELLGAAYREYCKRLAEWLPGTPQILIFALWVKLTGELEQT